MIRELNQTIYFINPNKYFGGMKTANDEIASLLSFGNKVFLSDEFSSSCPQNVIHDTFPIESNKKKIFKKSFEEHICAINPDTIIWGCIMLLPFYIPQIIRFYINGRKQVILFHSLPLTHSIRTQVIETIITIVSVLCHLVFVSSYTEQSWTKHYLIRKNRHRWVIKNPIDITPFQPKSIVDNQQITIGWVGRLSSEKRPELFGEFAKNNPEFRYEMWGDGYLHDIIHKEYGHFVEMKGYCNTANTIYKNIHILLISSLFENCPMVILEAKMRGIPIVAADVGGIHEILTSQEGRLLKDFSIPGVRKAIDEVIEHYKELSSNCIVSINDYSYEEIYKQWCKAIKS